MPPKALPPTEDFEARHERAVKLETTVQGLLHHRMVRQAHRVFDQEWEQVILPHLPLRYSFVLARLDRSGLTRLVEQADGETSPELTMYQGLDPRNPEQIGVLVDGKALGFLDKEAQGILERAGEHADLYYLKVIHLNLAGKPELQVDLVRPDLHTCSACGALHSEDKPKCADCRKKNKRKARGLEHTTEIAPVPLVRAFTKLTQEPAAD